MLGHAVGVPSCVPGIVLQTVVQSRLAGHQGEIGHGGGQIQLAFGLGPTETAGLAHPQLRQASQSVLRRHPQAPIRGKGGAVLQRPGLLQQALQGMQAHGAPHARAGGHAPRPQGAGVAHCALEPEACRLADAARAVGAGGHGYLVASDLSGWTGTGALGQVDDKVVLGEVGALRPPRHAGHQSAACVGEVLPGAAVPVGGIAHGFHHRRAGADLALRHQLQGPPAVLDKGIS